MDEIKWLEVAVNTTPDRLDEVTAKLTAAGMTGLVIEDEGEFQQFLEQNRQYWDYVDQELMDRMRGVTRVKFYVTDDGAGRVQLEQYTRGLDAEYTVTPLTDNDWAYSWQKYYKPLEVGRRLYVVPEWMRDEPVPEGRSPLYLNPGLTFGTGSHASTQLCLEGVEEHTLTGRPVLDLGCGSGILSIAALCLGASTAAAVDIDPKAVDVAYENAALNGIGRDRYTVRAGDILSDRALAAQLAINPNTIQRAYNELEGEGYIYSVPGKGSFAAANAAADSARRAELLTQVRELLSELRYLGVSQQELLALVKEVTAS